MPSNDGSAASVAFRVSITRCPRAPLGGRSRRNPHQRQHPVKRQPVRMPRHLRHRQRHGFNFQVHTSLTFSTHLIVCQRELQLVIRHIARHDDSLRCHHRAKRAICFSPVILSAVAGRRYRRDYFTRIPTGDVTPACRTRSARHAGNPRIRRTSFTVSTPHPIRIC